MRWFPYLCTDGIAFQSTRIVLGGLNLEVGPDALFPWSLILAPRMGLGCHPLWFKHSAAALFPCL